MELILPQSLKFLDPYSLGRNGNLPPLGLIKSDTFTMDNLLSFKPAEAPLIHVVFPVKNAAEAENLEKLIALLDPLSQSLIHQGWLAFGGDNPGKLVELTNSYRWLRLFQARLFPPPDQTNLALGKGAVMRALLYYLISSGRATDPRTIIQFIDADIVPSFFHPNWIIGAVGPLLWFQAAEAAKIVYFRPGGGRLNTFLRSLLAILPNEGLQQLSDLIYLLSGEMAATLRFWSSIPFKTGYGVEIMMLLSLALNQARLHPGKNDLEQVVQVFVGNMDHRHAPLQSSRSQQGLDRMAGNVFHTVFEVLEQAKLVTWADNKSILRRLLIPIPGTEPEWQPEMLQVNVGELTLPPLRQLPEIAAVLNW